MFLETKLSFFRQSIKEADWSFLLLFREDVSKNSYFSSSPLLSLASSFQKFKTFSFNFKSKSSTLKSSVSNDLFAECLAGFGQ